MFEVKSGSGGGAPQFVGSTGGAPPTGAPGRDQRGWNPFGGTGAAAAAVNAKRDRYRQQGANFYRNKEFMKERFNRRWDTVNRQWVPMTSEQIKKTKAKRRLRKDRARRDRWNQKRREEGNKKKTKTIKKDK